MRRYALLVFGMAALVGVLTVGIATAASGEGPITVSVGEETEVMVDGGFSPRGLSKFTYTPIRGSATEKVRAFAHPPAERELLVELDKNVMIQVKGLPACHPQLQTGLTVDEACKGAVIGGGEETVQIAYPENKAIDVPARAKVLNGGERDGTITIYVHANFSNPISGSLLTKVTVTRIHHGRFGWLADAKLPQIAGGYGSVVDFSLAIGRQYAYKGRKVSVLLGRCADGELRVHFQAGFEDGTSGEAAIARACTATG
jgi:hypothetical protein